MPSSAPWAAAANPSSRSEATSSASIAGMSASTIVLSPGCALPRACTPSRAARHAAVQPGRSTRSCPARAPPICRKSVPYNGPAAPPTLDTSAMATVLSTVPGSACSAASSFSTALRIPRSMFVPWSPSPIAVSRRTSSCRCSPISPAKRRIQSIAPSRVITALRAPAQARGVHRCVPVAHHLVVELEQRDRAALHLQRGDVVADQVALDGQPVLLRDLRHLGVDHVELEQRRAAHAVDEGQHPVAGREREVLEDRRHQSLRDLRGRTDLLAEAPGLAVDADADLD